MALEAWLIHIAIYIYNLYTILYNTKWYTHRHHAPRPRHTHARPYSQITPSCRTPSPPPPLSPPILASLTNTRTTAHNPHTRMHIHADTHTHKCHTCKHVPTHIIQCTRTRNLRLIIQIHVKLLGGGKNPRAPQQKDISTRTDALAYILTDNNVL